MNDYKTYVSVGPKRKGHRKTVEMVTFVNKSDSYYTRTLSFPSSYLSLPLRSNQVTILQYYHSQNILGDIICQPMIRLNISLITEIIPWIKPDLL